MTLNIPIKLGATVSSQDVMRVYFGLKTLTLPKPEWTHGAHLCAGVAIVSDLGLERACREMPGIIKAYNISSNVMNTETDGYHHTITLFYLKMTDRFLTNNGAAPLNENLGKNASLLLGSDYADREFPLKYYTKARLFSKEARLKWKEPDHKKI